MIQCYIRNHVRSETSKILYSLERPANSEIMFLMLHEDYIIWQTPQEKSFKSLTGIRNHR